MSEERRGVQVTPDSAARRSFLQTAALGGGLLAGGLAAPSPALAQGGGEDVLQKVIKSKQINIAVVIYPPLTIKQGNELAGTFVEAARWLAKQMDAQPNFIESEFGTFIAAIQSGRADIALSGSFATVPRAVAEGRRIIRNTHRVAKLFVAKSVYSALILATLGLAPIAYPFLARQITIASTLTIGVPAFFLALAPSEGPVRREGFMRSLLAFVVPAGVVTAATIVAGYLVVRGPLDASVTDGRTAAVLVTTGMGLAIVVEVEVGEGSVVEVVGTLRVVSVGAAVVGALAQVVVDVSPPQAARVAMITAPIPMARLEVIRIERR